MTLLRIKAAALLTIAKSIEDENFHDDVTVDEQALLEEVVRAVRAAGNLLMLHVNIIERVEAPVVRIERTESKLRVIK